MKSITPSPISPAAKDSRNGSNLLLTGTRPLGKRKTQTLRAWIDRDGRGCPFLSKVSFADKVHIKSTGTTIRQAALDFNLLHARDLITGRLSSGREATPPKQEELILTDALPQRALSMKPAWAWLILHGKNIENRSKPTKMRGRVLIHAGLDMTKEEYQAAWIAAAAEDIDLPALEDLPKGGIIGEMTITDCVTSHPSRWFIGPFGYVLGSVKPLDFIPCKGALGFFKPNLP